MKSALMRRLEKVENALTPKVDILFVATPGSWGNLTDEEVDDRIARWRAGENFGEARTGTKRSGLAAISQAGMRADLDIADRQRAQVRSIRFVAVDSARHPSFRDQDR